MGPVNICIIYDCLYPWTIGGAERWYRLLAEHLAANGHRVTYLTRDQWSPSPPPDISGVRVIPVSGPDHLYADARRAIRPPIAFGVGIHRYLSRNGHEFDAIACASFPYFSTLAAQRHQRRCGYRLVVDWWEVWSDAYWSEYLGPGLGRAGMLVQGLCARAPHLARCASELHRRRLSELGYRGPVLPIGGIFQSPTPDPARRPADSYVAVIGRLNPEKGSDTIVPALEHARRAIPGLRVVIAGDGPSRDALVRDAARKDLASAVEFRGFVSEQELDRIIGGALTLLNPSRREGFGLSVLDAACRGVPSVLAAGPDNAATALVTPGVNGEIAATGEADELASAILRVHTAGPALRRSTACWWTEHRGRLQAEDGLRRAEAVLTGAESGP